MSTELHPYQFLTPDAVLTAIEQLGHACDGRLQALNSYENRVFQIGIEDQPALVAKFYRPGRWSAATILEEHRFTQELAAADLPVIAPLADAKGNTLPECTVAEGVSFLFALYPSQGGRPPELDRPEHLQQLGRSLARLHNIGERQRFVERIDWTPDTIGLPALELLRQSRLIPPELADSFNAIAEAMLTGIAHCFERAGQVKQLRLHGDCHPGNILVRDGQQWLLDFDDACNGPAIQDLWLFLSGDREYMTARLDDLLRGYTGFRRFDARELHLVEALRGLRMLHHAAWIARRWDDPAFPLAFPYFNGRRYWDELILSLREQTGQLDEPPLAWYP